MIIERIGVRQFQRHLMPASLEFVGRGVTLVEGPNEAGKTTMFRALREAFLRSSGSTASIVKKFQPWNGAGNLAPEVTVDFTHGGKYYRLIKRWGARKESLLHIYPSAERRDNDAKMDANPDEFLATIFAGKTGSTTALTAPQQGLMHLLFTPQGRVRLDDPEGLGDAARLRLAEIIGVAAENDVETAVVRNIKRSHDDVYTGKGKLKVAAQSNVLAEKLSQTEAALQEARREETDIETLRADLDDVLQRVTISAQRYDDAKLRKEQDIPKLFNAQKIKHQVDKARQELETHARAYDELVSAARTLENLQAQGLELNKSLTAAQQNAAAAVTAAESAEQDYVAATTAANSAAAEDEEMVRLQSEHDRLALALRLQTERDALLADLRRVDETDEAISELAARLAETHAVSLEVVNRAKTLQAEVTALNARIEASQLVMSVAANKPFEATVTSSSGSSRIALAAGENATIRSDGTLGVGLGNASITIRGPVADLSADTEQLAALRGALAEIEAEFGTHDPLLLSQIANRRADTEKRLSDLKSQRGALIAGNSRQELSARLELLQSRLTDQAIDPGVVTAIKTQLDQRRRQVEEVRLQTRGAREVADAAYNTARQQRDEAVQGVSRIREDLISIEGKLAMIPAAGSSPDERHALQARAYGKREEARNALAVVEAEYEPYATLGDPDKLLEVLEKAVDEAQQLLSRHKDTQLRIETTLQTKRESGVAARVPALEAQQSALERKLCNARTAEQSIRLLHTTIDKRLHQRNTMLAGPVIPLVCEWYRVVTGKRIAELNIDTKAAVAGMRFVDCDADVFLDDLSAGAADQLCLLIRLAYAKVLADYNPDEPMPVVLDDVLVNCDEHRRRRMLEIINRVAEQTQVIILTCDPSPYLGQGWKNTSLESKVERGNLAPT